MAVPVDFAKDEDTAREHIQKLRKKWELPDGRPIDVNLNLFRVAQKHLHQYGMI